MTGAPTNLSHRASRGAAVTAGGLWMKTLIQLASTMVLARLLDPADFRLVALVVAASAPLIAALYGENRLVILTLAIAPTLLLNGIGMPMQAALQRQLRFG